MAEAEALLPQRSRRDAKEGDHRRGDANRFSAAMDERAPITVAAPASPSASPIQRNTPTFSPAKCGAISPTRIGCRHTMMATPPAETPQRRQSRRGRNTPPE
jgi:hypothetical protein